MKRITRTNQAGFTIIEYIVALIVAAIAATMVYTYFGQTISKSSDPIFRFQKASNLRLIMENIVADYNRLSAINLRYLWRPSTKYRLGSIVTPKTIPAAPNGQRYYKCTAITGTGTSGTTEPAWPTTSGVSIPDNEVTWTASDNIIWQGGIAYTVNTIVVPIINNGHYYRCSAIRGTAINVTTEPAAGWSTSPGGTTTASSGTDQIDWTEAGTILKSSFVTDNLSSYLISSPGRYGTGYTVLLPTSANASFIAFDSSNNETVATGEQNILKVTIKSNDSVEAISEIFTIN